MFRYIYMNILLFFRTNLQRFVSILRHSILMHLTMMNWKMLITCLCDGRNISWYLITQYGILVVLHLLVFITYVFKNLLPLLKDITITEVLNGEKITMIWPFLLVLFILFSNFRYQTLCLTHVPEHSTQIYEFRWFIE